jgi:hypothetical protein
MQAGHYSGTFPGQGTLFQLPPTRLDKANPRRGISSSGVSARTSLRDGRPIPLGAERVCDSRAAALIFKKFKKEQKIQVILLIPRF